MYQDIVPDGYVQSATSVSYTLQKPWEKLLLGDIGVALSPANEHEWMKNVQFTMYDVRLWHADQLDSSVHRFAQISTD
ncbi:MAG: hypothetical protein LRZ88_12440 [Candidatus Cloacimonetes bacterium]|nr:hypothetical protein [Candidatus Cloacimonadota bacterium]